jgi:type II secretory pathway pseudopilin PulG
VGVVAAMVILATSFPAAALLGQHRQLSAADARLAAIQRENRLLAEQQRQLSSTTEIERLARADYQLVSPGQTLYEILPPASSSATTTKGSAPTTTDTPGDPADQPLVSPSSAPDLTPDPGLPPTTPSATASTTATRTGVATGSRSAPGGEKPGVPGYLQRVLGSLEFWK